MAQATRSSDPRLRTPQFQEHRDNLTLRALENIRLQPETNTIPRSTVICKADLSRTLSERLRHAHPRPPTPPRPSQKQLGEEEGESHWDDDVDSMNIPTTTANNAGWDEDGNDEGADNATPEYNIQSEETTSREGSQVDDDELEAGDCTTGDDSSQSNRHYTQEELVILTRKIFGDDDEEVDVAFWDDGDGAPWAAVDHPAKDEGTGVDHQDQESDTGEVSEVGECEGKANETSKSDGLFGPTSNFCLSTSSKDGLPRSHEDEDDDQSAEVAQDVLDTAAGSAPVDTSDNVNSLEDDTPPTTTTFAPLTSSEPPRTAIGPSPPAQRPLSSESGFGVRSTKGGSPTGNLQPEESLGAGGEPSEGLSDPLHLPASQLVPSAEEMEPCKPAAVTPSEEERHHGTMRHIIRKKGLPEFSPTRPGIFSAQILNSSDPAPLGKRKRSQEDDGYEGEKGFSSAPIPQRDRQILCPR